MYQVIIIVNINIKIFKKCFKKHLLYADIKVYILYATMCII